VFTVAFGVGVFILDYRIDGKLSRQHDYLAIQVREFKEALRNQTAV